ncbi:MAG TPA: TonB family protein [Edaphobacter sp.]
MKIPVSLAMLGVAVVLSVRMAEAEDVQLRARAIELMSRAKVASTIKGGPYSFRTEVTFRTIGMDGARSGNLVRLRGKGLRQDVVWGDYKASMIGVGMQRATLGPWDMQPYSVRQLLLLVPFSVGEFDSEDVIREIRDGQTMGQNSTCVLFETIRGERRDRDEVCFAKTSGVMLEAQVGGTTYEYTGYREVAGALLPGHIEYREAGGFSLNADVSTTKVDSLPEDAFAFPADAEVRNLCHRFSWPVPLSVPQPAVGGGESSAVTTVSLQAEVSAEGIVTEANVIRSDRPELNAEAVKTVLGWKYQPGICDGKPGAMTMDIEVRFQGR